MLVQQLITKRIISNWKTSRFWSRPPSYLEVVRRAPYLSRAPPLSGLLLDAGTSPSLRLNLGQEKGVNLHLHPRRRLRLTLSKQSRNRPVRTNYRRRDLVGD